MSSPSWKSNLRRPRYESSGTHEARVELELRSEGGPSRVPAELVNLSRDGFQLRTPAPLAVGEAVTLRLRVEESGFETTLSGKVRWKRSEGEARLVGCLCDRPIEWESLGELFLGRVLSQDGP